MKRRDFLEKAALGSITIPTNLNMLSPVASPVLKKKGNIDPWLELSQSAYKHNAYAISKVAGGRPVLAVLKNNAYGLGVVEVGRILDGMQEVSGYAVIKSSEALAMRRGGVKKPILLMADFDAGEGIDLIEQDITLATFSTDSTSKITEIARGLGKKANVQLYIDTGIGRMGMPYHRVSGWLESISNNQSLAVKGIFTTMTTPDDFAKEQIERFTAVVESCNRAGIKDVVTHAAPSYSILRLPESHFDMVRPGILIHGSSPGGSELAKIDLQPVFRLRAGVVRMEKLRKGDTVGFSRFYEAKKPVWIATLPVGWADGYASAAENGAVAMVNNKLFRVINVNASHCNLEIGDEEDVKVGDIATLIGPDDPAITPHGFAERIKGHNYLQINFKELLPKLVLESF